MRKKMICLGTVLLASQLVTSVSMAEAPGGTTIVSEQQTEQQGVRTSTVSPAKTTADVASLLARIAGWSEFADWEKAQAFHVRTLYDPSGHPNAELWQIKRAGRPAGYLVTTRDGRQAYEFSHRPLPSVPESLQHKVLDNGFLYAGPLLHLVYVHGLEGLELYDLNTGETLPAGELVNQVPALTAVANENVNGSVQTSEQLLPRSASLADDAFYATGLFGQYKLQQQKGILPLPDYFTGDANWKTKRAFVVYDAIPDKMTVPLAMTKVVTQGSLTYVGLQNPFAEEAASEQPVYIDSRFPVYVVPLGAGANTPSATYSKAK